MIEQILIYLLEKWKNRESLKTFGAERSPMWRKVRSEHLKKFPNCAVCGGTETLEIHHKLPFHLDPKLELDPKNLITLCESGRNGIVCHRGIGHLGSYQSYNKDIEKDAKWLKEKIKNRP